MAREVSDPAIPFADDPATWQRYDGFVRRLAERLLGDADAADDVAQQVWQAALRRGPNARAAWPAWLRRVATRLAGRHARGEGRLRARQAQAEPRAPAPSPDEIRAREEARRVVIEAVLALREPYREVVVLHYLEERPARAIALQLGVPLETVRTRLKRALELLRAELRARRGDAWWRALVALPLARPTPWLAVASSSLAVWLLMQHKLKVVAAALAAVTWLVWWSLSSATPSLPAASAPHDAILSSRQDLTATASSTASMAQRTPAAPPELVATGVLLVRVTWHDGTPAANVVVRVDPQDVPLPELTWQSGTTGADGEVRFAEIPPGRASVDAVGRSGGIAVTIVSGSTVEGLITLGSGFKVRGRVVDERGDAVPDAALCIESGDLQFDAQIGRSDAEGRFTLRDVGRTNLGARKPGYAPSVFHFLRARDGELELNLELTRGGGAVEGMVLTPGGQPAAGALVIVGERQWLGFGMANGGDAKRAPPLRTTCDDKGRFRADGLSAQGMPLRVSHASAAPWLGEVDVPAGATTALVVTLQAPAAVVGVVRGDDGQPLSTAWLRLVKYPDALAAHPVHPFFSRGTEVAADGTFRLDHLPLGEVVVRAEHGDHASLDTTLSLGPGEVVRWEPRLSKGRTVRGRLVDLDGVPVPRVHVEAVVNGRHTGMHPTDREGRFAIPHVTGDAFDWFAVVRDDPVERVSLGKVSIPSGELTVTVRARPTGRVGIHGRIVDGDGKAIMHAEIRVVGSQTIIEPPASDGSFTRSLAPGRYGLRVNAMGFGTFDVGPRVLHDGDTWDVGEVRLGAAARVDVHASLAPGLRWPAAIPRVHGEPYLPVHGELVDEHGRARAHTTMREPGRLVFSTVAAGRYRLLVVGDDFACAPIDVVAEAGAKCVAQVALVPGVRHEFRVAFGRKPPAWAEVELLDVGGATLDFVRLAIDADGTGTATRRVAVERCTARLWGDDKLAPDVALEHRIVR